MQYVSGERRTTCDHAPLSIDESDRIRGEISDGLAAIHDAGIIHRDIKPQNVLMSEQRLLKLSDFGIARLESASAGLTESGTALGRRPTWLRSRRRANTFGRETDLYAVGVILYEMTTGRLPFPGDNPVQVMYRHVNEDPPPPRSINPSIPVTVESFILRAMAKDPADRFHSAKAMRDALLSPGMAAAPRRREPVIDPNQATAVTTAVAAGGPPFAPPPVYYYADDDRRRPWAIILGLVALLLVILLVAAIALAGNGDDDDESPVLAAADRTQTAGAVAPTAPRRRSQRQPTSQPRRRSRRPRRRLRRRRSSQARHRSRHRRQSQPSRQHRFRRHRFRRPKRRFRRRTRRSRRRHLTLRSTSRCRSRQSRSRSVWQRRHDGGGRLRGRLPAAGREAVRAAGSASLRPGQ